MSIERYKNHVTTPWTGEHLHRYYYALPFLHNGAKVLDIATGSGYGAKILSQISDSSIIGGDIDSESIADAHQSFGSDTISFEVMDGTQLRFQDAYFDAVVSFETIEHTTAYLKMITEFSRVIKPGGMLIISTPNIKVSSPDGIIRNKYHTQEFTYEQFRDMLTASFTDVQIMGQYNARYRRVKKPLMQLTEKMLLLRGVRKLPYAFRNFIMRSLWKTELYPTAEDFDMSSDKGFIEKNCFVLFAICKK